MSTDEIRGEWVRPLSPFAVQMKDGRYLAVQHPNFIAIGTRLVSITNRDDTSHTLNSANIATVRPLIVEDI